MFTIRHTHLPLWNPAALALERMAITNNAAMKDYLGMPLSYIAK
jgi:hypothetical protein